MQAQDKKINVVNAVSSGIRNIGKVSNLFNSVLGLTAGNVAGVLVYNNFLATPEEQFENI